MSKLDSNFYQKLLQLSQKVGMKPEHILNVMAVESGLDPGARNPHGNASGLVQIMPKFLPGLGFKGTPEEFRQIGGAAQLDFVEKIINNLMRINGGPLTSATQYYIGNFLPVALTLPGIRKNNPDTIIVSQNPTEPHLPNIGIEKEKSFYNSNKGLDFDHDGNITFGDIQKVLDRAKSKESYQKAIVELNKYRGTSSESTDSVFSNLNNKKAPITAPPKAVQDLLSRYLALVAAQDNPRKMFKKYLPYNSAVIKITANNANESLEFARILSLALDEELSAKVSTHLENGLVEIECDVAGPSAESFQAIDQLSVALADVFFDVTKKIGGVKVKTEVITNKKSSYKPVNLKLAESEHRKFLLKFVEGT